MFLGVFLLDPTVFQPRFESICELSRRKPNLQFIHCNLSKKLLYANHLQFCKICCKYHKTLTFSMVIFIFGQK